MSNSKLIAGIIAISMVLWLLSGDFAAEGVIADEMNPGVEAGQDAGDAENKNVPLVRAIKSSAEERGVYLDVRGQTHANRMVEVKAEVAGVVEAVPGVKGSKVAKGDLLCQIAVDSRRSDLARALADLKSAQLEYDGTRDLNQRGLQSEIILAKTEAALEQSRSRVKQAELALQKTRIVAPFDGVVEDQPAEVGNFMSPGSTCVSVIEVDPMLVVGRVSEKSIGRVSLGDSVRTKLITGEQYEATVSFISRTPDEVTRTYQVEATIDNPSDEIRAGLTANMQVPTSREFAHLISSASLVLNDEGTVGVRIVDDTNVVQFKPINIVSEGAEGVWVTGLPQQTNVITVGQEEVFDGQVVKVDFTPLTSIASS